MDCLSSALVALKLVGITLSTIPAIAINGDFEALGGYMRLGEQPVVILRDPNNCYVLAHELVHEFQFERRGEPIGKVEIWRTEVEASAITANANERYKSVYGSALAGAERGVVRY